MFEQNNTRHSDLATVSKGNKFQLQLREFVEIMRPAEWDENCSTPVHKTTEIKL